jgi:erythronate-4-phosphate dehydrogenase
MKIVADDKIPLITDYFGAEGELILIPGRALQASDVADADLLIVRSVTHVNADLLRDSKVSFVGSVASGADHLDTAWLDSAGIHWASATGSNAISVVEYVICAIAALQKMSLLNEKKPRAAVIGVGRIGSEVARQLEMLGFDVLLCDPIRAKQENDFISTPLSAIADCDFITFHTPLTHKGSDPTYHMIAKNFLQRQKKNTVLLNASRGSVIDFSDLKEYGEALYWCLDVWENEPFIDFQVLELAALATPHIAGHTRQAKQRGLDMIYHAAVRENIIAPRGAIAIHFPEHVLDFNQQAVDWRDVILKIYNPAESTELMKQKMIESSEEKIFDRLRNDFNSRYEFHFVTVKNACLTPQDKNYLLKIGVKVL